MNRLDCTLPEELVAVWFYDSDTWGVFSARACLGVAGSVGAAMQDACANLGAGEADYDLACNSSDVYRFRLHVRRRRVKPGED